MSLNLITVVGNSAIMLPHMLKHYEQLVDNVYVVIYKHSENDPIEEEVLKLGIKPYKIIVADKFNWELLTKLYNDITSTKPNDWWIVADTDEIHINPESYDYIIRNCERHGYDFVTGGFLDRIGNNGNFPIIKSDSDIFKLFPMAGFFGYPIANSCPNKVTLMKGNQELATGQHYVLFQDGTNSWGNYHPNKYPTEEIFTQVHHFKWDSTILERLKSVVNTKKQYTYWWEYEKMYNTIKANDFKIDINNSKFKIRNINDYSFDTGRYWKRLTRTIVKI